MDNIKDISSAPAPPQVAHELPEEDKQVQSPTQDQKRVEQVSSPISANTSLFEVPAPPSAPDRDDPKLPKEEEEEVFRALQSIFQSVEEEDGSFGVKGLLNSLDEVDGEARCGQRNLNILKGVVDKLGLLWRSGSTYMTRSAEVLANGCRDPSWRVPYGQSGILEFFLRIIATNNVDDDILLHSLRLIGNSCADTNENRQLVVEKNYTLPIIKLFRNPAVLHVAIPVIYNICTDFEPAQAQVAANGIGYSLLSLLSESLIEENALLIYTFELLETATDQSQGVARSPDGTLPLIINLASDEDIDFNRFEVHPPLADVRHIFFAILFPEEVQYSHNCGLRINPSALKHLCLSSCSFREVPSPTVNFLKPCDRGLEEPEGQLQVCACVMLGNLAREDAICISMVQDFKIHVPLISILNGNTIGAVLHPVLGFLKNLAIAGHNKEHLGSAGIIKAVSRLWAFESVPQVQFSAACLTRQVIVSSFYNISRLMEPLSADHDSPTNSRTYLSLLLSLFQKTDSTPIKIEIGRTICAICRSISQRRQQNGTDLAVEVSIVSERLYKLHEDVALPIGAMVAQTEWPVVQSEGWFALALMASTQLGSLAVVKSLQSMKVFQLVIDTVKAVISEVSIGESVQEKTERLKKSKDRDNAIILVNGLLKNNPITLPNARREMLEDLMRDVAGTYQAS
ncbi:hypothetical protein PAAG_12202 [Paracoccidioides lutzii Pb01]|uniref:GTP binding protein n=1 Tax=Paracoccidioides lutzii (strain ATCC MYA-826 / Pb01) TaxID=502779 RepID=A0A0A2V3Y1_PARBA|nr:hypothetical protein PAAG_12202 [Paracoccidioides lutzii Pb01]KGQ01077.1 hypothetical protein PAAG_12202 [Paracoccidioides lutzii Pb01]